MTFTYKQAQMESAGALHIFYADFADFCNKCAKFCAIDFNMAKM